MTDELCPCGRPLHYSNPRVQKIVESYIAKQGSSQVVTVLGVGDFMVPRHFIALHGIKAAEILELAQRYGWPRAGEKGSHGG